MNEIKFNSIEELYKRVLPALKSKVKELKFNNINYVKEEDIWNCLRNLKWDNCNALSLSEMVDDILNTDNIKFDTYIKKKMESLPREDIPKEESFI